MNKTVKKFSIQELCFIKPPKVYGLRFVDYSDYAALEAELARVKSESLRVVPVGEVCRAEELAGEVNFALWRDQIVMPEPHFWGWSCLDGSYPGVYTNDEMLEVRLERWEDDTHATGN